MKKIISGLLGLLTIAPMSIAAYHNPLHQDAPQNSFAQYTITPVQIPQMVTTVAAIRRKGAAPKRGKEAKPRKRKATRPQRIGSKPKRSPYDFYF